MSRCQCEGIEQQFGGRFVAFEMWRYRRKGPTKPTRLLLEMIRTFGVRGNTLLDIGGGVGAIQHELAADGLRSIYSVDGASSYVAAAQAEAKRRGYADRVKYIHGDFVARSSEVPEVDLVTLDKVICCYDDMDDLVSRSAEKARLGCGLVFPREEWWTRLNRRVINFMCRARRSPFRFFVHRESDVENTLRTAGFTRHRSTRTFFWNVILYRREALLP